MRTGTRHLLKLLGVAAALTLLATACSDDDTQTDAGSGEPAATNADASPADLQLASSDLGEILVDAGGNTLYLLVPDARAESTCYDDCELNWPVVREVGTVGDGLDAALLGTTERTDGVVQATYNGWPLYRFINDAAPGDTNGQGINDVWYVVGATGDAVEAP